MEEENKQKDLKNEVAESLNGVLKKHIFNPVYLTFVLSWLFFHWRVWVILFFVDEEKIFKKFGYLKDEYLRKIIFDSSWQEQVSSFLLPFLMTYLIVWLFPKLVLLSAFEEDETHRAKKFIIRIKKDKKIEEEKKELEKEKLEKTEIIIEKKKKEKEVKDQNPEILWKKEYQHFKKTNFFKKFKYIIDSIYKHKGHTRVWNLNNQISFEIPGNLLSYCHVNKIINFTNEEKEKIDLTEKGEFFVNKYHLEDDPSEFPF
ncbi:hypothetical protein ACFLY7_02230 [Patescibacteria group bacterium]